MRATHLTVLVILLTAGACERIWPKPTPLYTARAYLEVLPEVDRSPEIMPSIGGAASGIEERLRTHAELIKAEPILVRAMTDSDVQQTAWYRESPDTAVARLRDILEVNAIRDTSLIAVEVTTYDPITAAALANAVAIAYVDDHSEAAKRVFDEHLADLHEEQERLETDIDRLNDVVRSTAGYTASQGEQIRWEELIRELTRQQVALTGQLPPARALHQRLVELKEQGTLAEAPEVLDRLNADPSYAQLLKLNSEASAGLQLLLTQYDESHPAVTEATQRLQTIEEQQAEMEQLAGKLVVANAEIAVLELGNSIERGANELEAAVIELRRTVAGAAQLDSMRIRLEELNGRLVRINETIAETRLLQDRAPTVRLRQAAVVPTKPSRTE